MKKNVKIGVAVVTTIVIGIVAYLLLSGPKSPAFEFKVIPGYTTADVMVDLEDNGVLIDFEASKVELYRNGVMFGSEKITDLTNNVSFESLDLESNYELKLTISYDCKKEENCVITETSKVKPLLNKKWDNVVDSQRSFFGHGVVTLDDSTFAFFGYKKEDNIDNSLLKVFNSEGEYLFEKRYDLGYSAHVKLVSKAIGENVLVIYQEKANGYDYYIQVLDRKGNVLNETNDSEWTNVGRITDVSTNMVIQDDHYVLSVVIDEKVSLLKFDQELKFVEVINDVYESSDANLNVREASLYQTEEGYILSTIEAGNSYDSNAFISKLDSELNVVWSSQIDYGDQFSIEGVVVDGKNVFVSGNLLTVTPNSSGNGYSAISEGSLVKIDETGQIAWIDTKQFEDTYVGNLVVDNYGRILVATVDKRWGRSFNLRVYNQDGKLKSKRAINSAYWPMITSNKNGVAMMAFTNDELHISYYSYE